MHQKSLSSSDSHTSSQDYIVGVIYDKIKDGYLMINYRQRGGLWFLFTERRMNETSLQAIKRLLDPVIIYDADQIQLVKVCSTKTLPFKGRDVLFYAILPKSTTTINIWLNGKIDGIDFERQLNNLPDNAVVWLTTIQLKSISKLSRLLGMEPLLLHKQFKDIFHSTIKMNTINSTVIFEEIKIPQIETQSKTVHNNAAETLLISAKFTTTIQEKLYEEYHNAVLPSDYLNFETFKELILPKGLESQHILDYFRAFDSTQRNYLTFLDYLLGLAALDPNTQHGGVPAEQRCRYIFRYYNINNNQRMTFDEFKLMIKDIHKNKGQQLTGDALNDEASQMFRSFGLRSSDQTLSLMDFLSGVGQLRFRGTSVLFRLTMPISDLLKRSSIKSNTLIIPSNIITSNRTLSTMTMARRSGTQQQISIEESHPYEIATHIVKVC
jgi:Ca2+-binding EF-hand superfamily protein